MFFFLNYTIDNTVFLTNLDRLRTVPHRTHRLLRLNNVKNGGYGHAMEPEFFRVSGSGWALKTRNLNPNTRKNRVPLYGYGRVR